MKQTGHVGTEKGSKRKTVWKILGQHVESPEPAERNIEAAEKANTTGHLGQDWDTLLSLAKEMDGPKRDKATVWKGKDTQDRETDMSTSTCSSSPSVLH